MTERPLIIRTLILVCVIFIVHLICERILDALPLKGFFASLCEGVLNMCVLIPFLLVMIIRPLFQEISRRRMIASALAESEATLSTIFNSVQHAIFIHAPNGSIHRVNEKMLSMYGVASLEEACSLSIAEDLSGPEAPVASIGAIWKRVINGGIETFEWQARRPDDGTLFDVEVSLHKIVLVGKEMILASVTDISHRKQYENALQQNVDQLRLAATVINTTIEGVTITDPHANILSVNPAFTTITGYSAEEAIGQNPRVLKSDRHDADYYREMWATLTTSGHWRGEIWNRRKSGEAYPEWLTISAITDGQGATTHYVAVFHDITESKQNEAQIKYQAYHDALTGLPNRQLFNDRLSLALAHAKRHQLCVAVLFLDLDRFKNINDTLGHLLGDRLLQSVAERLCACVRNDDTVARLGGDEFTILLADISHPEQATLVAGKVVDAFKQPFQINGHELYSTPSLGISIYPMDGSETDVLMKNADTALYRAKAQGRNNYQLYTPAMNEMALERLQMENGLRRALEREEFVLYYQPRIDLATGATSSVEALVRWQHPQHGLVAPGQFIPIAEESGLIIPLGDWVLRTACAQARSWMAAGHPPVRVAVNLSARQFEQENPVELVATVLRETGLEAEYLELEITESVTMHHVDRSLAMLRELTHLGVRIAIDDFGTGYSSLSYLKKFPVDTLKIDQSFVRDLPEDQDAAAIAVAIIGLARALNLHVVAEGVENERQLAFMRAYLCDEIQGYIFSRPIPADELARTFLSGVPQRIMQQLMLAN
jgi:diguanylate cyclase (GGDEF)-like protein/PAS domain S-box-containing protein